MTACAVALTALADTPSAEEPEIITPDPAHVGAGAPGLAYSTEATLSLQKEEGTCKAVVQVSKLVEQRGKVRWQLISQPRLQFAPGSPASLYVGLPPSNPNYTKEDNVSVDVSWPYPNESGVALCAVIVKRGDNMVSQSKFQLLVEGPGRAPLIVEAKDVDPKSVRVDEKLKGFVLLEFIGKTKAEVKKMSVENYGNKVHVRLLEGKLIEGGLSLGTYKEMGLALQYQTEDEARHVASLLRGENPQ